MNMYMNRLTHQCGAFSSAKWDFYIAEPLYSYFFVDLGCSCMSLPIHSFIYSNCLDTEDEWRHIFKETKGMK